MPSSTSPVADFDSRAFRHALGRFTTGVTIVTARGADGQPIGLTVNSFNSVSLDPPLVVWSLSANSPRLADFVAASHFAVNVLAVDQQALSDRFAGRDPERFAGLEPRQGLGGAPLFDGCCAWFECANEIRHEGGDHLVFIGRVERFATGDAHVPLVFHAGRYRALAEPAQ
ncbi:flavin reductase family protein [Rhodocyclus tenuis]|uniref:Flavin reductase n=2 Tax=Rhodocyclus TaxID=1064 RepID=A0A6L5JVH4_RHOTE|nr:flavin reductase family protein [Rhodocyclus gracilis]MQY51377.1 flavin reductase [Rhodocyclus gracilis]MRD72119.1 flavin reductase [Rhodocyclus gracilis]NJA89224.1 flavin reductase family protein [Rhodocyclus gracilis]